jgi:hypothetical protein
MTALDIRARPASDSLFARAIEQRFAEAESHLARAIEEDDPILMQISAAELDDLRLLAAANDVTLDGTQVGSISSR